jgi:hypothetical protein
MVARMVVGMRVDMAMVIELSGCKKKHPQRGWAEAC